MYGIVLQNPDRFYETRAGHQLLHMNSRCGAEGLKVRHRVNKKTAKTQTTDYLSRFSSEYFKQEKTDVSSHCRVQPSGGVRLLAFSRTAPVVAGGCITFVNVVHYSEEGEVEEGRPSEVYKPITPTICADKYRAVVSVCAS